MNRKNKMRTAWVAMAVGTIATGFLVACGSTTPEEGSTKRGLEYYETDTPKGEHVHCFQSGSAKTSTNTCWAPAVTITPSAPATP